MAQHPSTYAHLYAQALTGLDNPFVAYLRRAHKVPADDQKITFTNGLVSPEFPSFQNEWGQAHQYRYRPIQEASRESRSDPSLRRVLKSAESWIEELYNAMLNVVDTINRAEGHDMKIFTGPNLDKKAVEAACRAILVALIHRCVVGYCGPQSKIEGDRANKSDRVLDCEGKLRAIVSLLKRDKRVCRDVLYEDSKISRLVHCPLKVADVKESQQRNNDHKKKAHLLSKEKIEMLSHGVTNEDSAPSSPALPIKTANAKRNGSGSRTPAPSASTAGHSNGEAIPISKNRNSPNEETADAASALLMLHAGTKRFIDYMDMDDTGGQMKKPMV